MSTTRPVVYWHRDLPPLEAEVMDEHVVEAVSDRVPGMIERHGDGWDACHASLMARAAARLEQEVARLGGDYAHVVDEHVDSRRDDLTTESWLHGRFSYVLYRRGPDPA
ncbi:MAG: hypothetical protein IT181_05515 [Acidobacteria bacterium]|nr:hypothetical protein [Acidobacteriota bacterium]